MTAGCSHHSDYPALGVFDGPDQERRNEGLPPAECGYAARACRGINGLALRDQHVHLAELGNDLLGCVTLQCGALRPSSGSGSISS